MRIFTYFTVFLLVRSANYFSQGMLDQVHYLFLRDFDRTLRFQLICLLFIFVSFAILAANIAFVN